jgi:hypothetical protein
MHQRPIVNFRPGLESLEPKQLMSVQPLAAPLRLRARAAALREAAKAAVDSQVIMDVQPQGVKAEASASAPGSQGPTFRVDRITNPTPINHVLTPPFQQVMVQSNPPIPGGTYNIYFVSMRNSTRLTFDADSGLYVRFSGQNKEHAYPILTGDQQWKPNEVFVFYVLTKQYYPPRPIVSDGFEFNLAGSRGIAIGGPSGIFLRIKYDPARFPRMLDWIVTRGPGAYGHRTGIADTAIWQFTRTS